MKKLFDYINYGTVTMLLWGGNILLALFTDHKFSLYTILFIFSYTFVGIYEELRKLNKQRTFDVKIKS